MIKKAALTYKNRSKSDEILNSTHPEIDFGHFGIECFGDLNCGGDKDFMEKENLKGFYIKTMGCQMNEYDSDFLAQSLVRLGFTPVKEPGSADLILINTCAVREKPEQKTFSLLGRISSLKRKRPDLVIGVVGCVAQKEGGDLLQKFPEIDFVMGPRELDKIYTVLKSVYSGERHFVLTELETSLPRPVNEKHFFRGRVSGFISIMEGCNNFCSYCIVPYVRGREVSRPPEDIASEAEHLISEGILEITLLGQNVNSYKWDHERAWNFPALLRLVDKTEGLVRLRFTTSHPKDLSDNLTTCFQYVQTLCPHIHLPFQAGSDTVLERMKRGYTKAHYLSLVEKLRAARPDISITSDVMVGFPRESEQDFYETLDLIEQVEFDALFSFKYSDRKGTLAASLEPKVEEGEKQARLDELQKLQKSITLKKNKVLEGKEVKVLVEGKGKRPDQMMGRTPQNKVVNFVCNHNKIGQLVNVKITEGLHNSLRGELVDN